MPEIPPQAVQAAGEPDEIRDLPPQVRALVHAVDRMRDRWAEADEAVRAELWRAVHAANDAVWGRLDAASAGDRSDGDAPTRGCRAPQGYATTVPRLFGLSDDGTSVEARTALRKAYAEAMADRSGSPAFKIPGPAWDDCRSRWLGHADAVLAVRDDKLAALRAEAHRMTLAYNGANAMKGVHELRANRLRAELDHAKAALAGENEGIRAFMADHEAKMNRLREQRDMWQRDADRAEAAIDRAWAMHPRDDSNPRGPWCGTCTTVWPCATARALDVPADGEQPPTPATEEGNR